MLAMCFLDIVKSVITIRDLGERQFYHYYEELRHEAHNLAQQMSLEVFTNIRDFADIGDGWGFRSQDPVLMFSYIATLYLKHKKSNNPLEIRIGAHQGPTYLDGTNLKGINVSYCSRILSTLPNAGIVISDRVYESLVDDLGQEQISQWAWYREEQTIPGWDTLNCWYLQL